jgi:class 3 adenylate cyclase
LHQAIVDREEQGETLSRLLPDGLVEKLCRDGRHIGESEAVVVTVLMSDVRGYSGIAEWTDPAALATQLNEHRAEMNGAILGRAGSFRTGNRAVIGASCRRPARRNAWSTPLWATP